MSNNGWTGQAIFHTTADWPQSLIDGTVVDPCIVDNKRYMGGGNWIQLDKPISSDGITSITYSQSEEEQLKDIDDILEGIEEKVDSLEERLSKLECRLGDSLGRIEQSLDQIIRQVYKTY